MSNSPGRMAAAAPIPHARRLSTQSSSGSSAATATASSASTAAARPMQRMSSTASMRRTLGGTDLDQPPRMVGDHYQLGSQIGRGGFGVVFSALDLRSARSVAIKQVSLADMDAEALRAMESEVSLLRKLSHVNIVTYFDTIRTPTHLNIVLEYMENGSLAQFMKKFGSFSEPLVAMYIAQVLRGLHYLHEQGVLHRDVKGANILTTKDGLVKLADFGVAVKLSETTQNKTHSVVGSPYWMAPEVIEMSGWSFAADIWSVGCTIIELLTTKPPYFDLAPMAALFRIVQDDHPPLPERISPALQDFIMKCFRKEPRLRSSAAELLVHPWITQIPRLKMEQSSRLVAQSAAVSPRDRAGVLKTIQLYADTHGHDKEEEGEEAENWDEEFGVASEPTPLALEAKKKNQPHREPVAAGPAPTAPKAPVAGAFTLTKEDATALLDDEELWGDDDADDHDHKGPAATAAPVRRLEPQVKTHARDDDDHKHTWSGSAWIPVEKRLSKLRAFKESDDDHDHALQFLDIDEDQLIYAAAARKKQQQLHHHVQPQSSTTTTTATTSSTIPVAVGQGDDDDYTDLDLDGGNGFLDFANPAVPSTTTTSRLSAASSSSSSPDEWLDDDDELDFEYSSLGKDHHHKATNRVVELLKLLDPSMDDHVILEACTDLQELFAAHWTLPRDLLVSQPGVVPNIMDALEMKKVDVLCAVLQVVNTIIQDNKKFQEHLALVGLIPVVIRLTKWHTSSNITTGGSSSITTSDITTSADAADRVRLEAAKFVRQSCTTSSLTLQMFVACGGLPVLVDFLSVDPLKPLFAQKELLQIALHGIGSVFALQTIPKNDICRLFVKAGFLHQFITVFAAMASQLDQKDDPAVWPLHEELNRMCDVLVVFSQGDVVVKEHVSECGVVQAMLHVLLRVAASTTTQQEEQEDLAKLEIVLKLLKTVRNLSMEPVTLDNLDKSQTIETLATLLTRLQLQHAAQETGHVATKSKRREQENLILQTLFYLCRLNRTRQIHAAKATGVVSFLIHVVQSASPLKQFALPVLCDFCHAINAIGRQKLWENDGFALFLDLLRDKYWQTDAIKSLSAWLIHDPSQMENALLLGSGGSTEKGPDPANLIQLIQFFIQVQDSELDGVLEPFLEMLTRSLKLNQACGQSGLFMNELLLKLKRVPKAIVRKNLLKMLKSLFENHVSKRNFVVEYGLYQVVFAFAQDANSMILVKEIASQLLHGIQVATGVLDS